MLVGVQQKMSVSVSIIFLKRLKKTYYFEKVIYDLYYKSYKCCLVITCDDGWGEFENSCYKFTHEAKEYSVAESDCAANGAHLASIHSEEEMEFISTLQLQHVSASGSNFWLGGERDGNNFVWNDGSEFNYENWNRWEPNDAGGDEDCIEFYSVPGSYYHNKWNDIPCDATDRVTGYVCKKDK